MIQRRKPIARSRLKAKRTPVRKRRPGPARKGPMRSEAYRRWVSRFRCCVCNPLSLDMGECCEGNSQAAHAERNGMSSKGPDSSCVPLCVAHHNWYDGRSRASVLRFEKLDLKEIAARFYAWYQAQN